MAGIRNGGSSSLNLVFLAFRLGACGKRRTGLIWTEPCQATNGPTKTIAPPVFADRRCPLPASTDIPSGSPRSRMAQNSYPNSVP